MLESCFRTDLVVEITMQPVRRYGVDAAIFFSDIVVPLKAIGVDLDIVPGTGPVVAEPIRRPTSSTSCATSSPTTSRRITDAAKALVGELGGTPLIGFAGAPFTLASYLVEGGPSRDHRLTKELMYSRARAVARAARPARGDRRAVPAAAGRGRRLGDPAVRLVGRRAVARRLREYVAPHSAAVLAAVADLDVPRIHFGVGTGELLARHGRRRRRRRRRRLAGAARRGRAPDRARAGGAGQPRPDAAVRADRARARRAPPRSSPPVERPAATCSTSATACCRPPTPTRWRGSSTSSTLEHDASPAR